MSLAVSPDGGKVAVGGDEGQIYLFHLGVVSPTPISLGSSLKVSVASLTFSYDGQWLAAVDTSSAIYLWQLRGKQPTSYGPFSPTPSGPEVDGWNLAYAYSLAFSPDNKTLAVVTRWKNLILWDVESRAPVGILDAEDVSYSLAFSPDGTTLAAGGLRHSVLLFNIDPESWVKVACLMTSRRFTGSDLQQFGEGVLTQTCAADGNVR